jgi:proline iminopeptidase
MMCGGAAHHPFLGFQKEGLFMQLKTISSGSDLLRGSLSTSDGVDLYVEVRGNGTPCLYVHGGPASGSYWARKFTGDVLEKHFQMVYLDQRGACRSSSPKNEDYSMDRLVEDFEEVRKELGIDRWFTMGHSFGGLLQMGYVLRQPEVVSGMVMLNCSLNLNESFREGYLPAACEILGITDRSPYLDDAIPVLERWGSLISQLNEKGLMWRMGYADRDNERLMNASFDEVANFNHAEESAIEIEDYWDNFKPETAGVKVPVLFFYGKQDRMVGSEHYRGVGFPKMILWGSEVGHMPFMENKADLDLALACFRGNYGF